MQRSFRWASRFLSSDLRGLLAVGRALREHRPGVQSMRGAPGSAAVIARITGGPPEPSTFVFGPALAHGGLMLSNLCSRTDREDLARWEVEGGSTRSAWVLVVDDDDDYREAMVETLEDAGYRALGVASGEQALNAMHDEPFLVLADLRMPRMDGSELLTAMRAELGSRMPPVVFLTGAFPSMIENISAPILSKPVDIDRLLSVVGHHCLRGLAVRT